MAKHSKVLILGSGPAGYTAAIYAARAMLKPILVFGSEPGGQLTTTTDVENFPGYSKVIQGPWLMEEMKGQAKAVGTEMIQDHIKKVDLSKKPFEAIDTKTGKPTFVTNAQFAAEPGRYVPKGEDIGKVKRGQTESLQKLFTGNSVVKDFNTATSQYEKLLTSSERETSKVSEGVEGLFLNHSVENV